MRRQRQAISREECIEVLKCETRGVLSVIGDEGYPYGVPINHYYDEETGRLYFHGAKFGHRVEAAEKNDKACYTVYDKGFLKEGDWALNVRSVIIFGRLRPVTDEARAIELCRRLCYKFTDDEDYIADEIRRFAAATLVLELVPEQMTGKLVNEK
ncbi:MAG: pyridoxamine 5'-phosphate oxidase family protein [Ruminococcus sp.]|nr:pyridoxamine 5'-phosphate oxidase family protein [Ruminococcus sp.]